MPESSPLSLPTATWRLTRTCTAWKAPIGGRIRFYAHESPAQRFWLEVPLSMHAGQVDRLLIDGGLVPCDGQNLVEGREMLKQAVIADAFAAEPDRPMRRDARGRCACATCRPFYEREDSCGADAA